MFKSVFSKIFFTYLFILVTIMLVLIAGISALANNYVYSEKQRLLGNVGTKTTALANAYSSGNIDHKQLTEALNAMGYTTDTKIYIIQADSSMLDQLHLEEELNDPYLYNALSRVLNGESVFSRKQYSKGFEAQVVFAAYPWREANNIRGAILLFSPEETISAIIHNISLVSILMATAFLIIGGIVIYLFSRRFVRPIKAIDAASQLMANGEEAPDIEIRTKDELGALAKSFNTMKQKIKKNEQLRNELLSNISHDLRTPITTIYGFAGGMADGIIKQDDYPKYIGAIRSEARRLSTLTEELLESAKIQSGSIELSIVPFPLIRAVQAAINANEAQATEKNIEITSQIPSDFMVNADTKKLEQILYNLINNAVKYQGSGGSIQISAQNIDNAVEITVSDHGIGIREEDLPHVFDRYYRAKTAKAGGYGLGLSIVKTYVEAHGGKIRVESAVDKGTSFCFTMPND